MAKTALALSAALVAAGLSASGSAEVAGADQGRWFKTPTGYMLVLRKGDDVIGSLEALASQEKIPTASLTGIGFLREVTFGFYNFARKDFDPKTFNDVEMAGMTGSIAWKGDKPSIHAHATVAGRDFQAVGGHVLAAEVGTGSVEITVITHDTRLERKVDPEVGADVLQLE